MDMSILSEFDPNKPFYPLIMSYIASLHGYLELISRGTYHHIAGRRTDEIATWMAGRQGADSTPAKELLEKASSGTTKLIMPFEFGSTYLQDRISIDIDRLSNYYLGDAEHYRRIHNSVFAMAAGILVLAKEWTEKYRIDTDPLWEFLRHCRNAAAHGNTFTFRSHEPARTAQWGHLVITKKLEGYPLFTDPLPTGFLGLGDPIVLLRDLEHANPQLGT